MMIDPINQAQYLSEDYVPEKMLYREEQVKKVQHIFELFDKFRAGNNLVVLGVTGSGKTTIIKKGIADRANYIYANAASIKTAHKLINSLYDLKTKTYYESIKIITDNLKKNPKVLIFDEVDKIKDINTLFDILNTIYRAVPIPIIIVTLRRNIIENMPLDARHTLFFERVCLPSYNALELKNIIIERLHEVEMEVDEGIINYIAAIAGRQGSARIAIKLLLRCLQNQRFEKDFIDEQYVIISKMDWLEFLDDINDSEREFLKNIIQCADWENEVSSEKLTELTGLSTARISQICNSFEKYGVLTSRLINLGRAGGRRRLIKFVSQEMYEDIAKL